MKYILLLSFCSVWLTIPAAGQTAGIEGQIRSGEEPVSLVAITISGKGWQKGLFSDEQGRFRLENLAAGKYFLEVSSLGFRTLRDTVELQPGLDQKLSYQLQPDQLDLSEVVVSATRYQIDRREAPVIVQVLNDRIFESTQSMILSESLSFQPGVRVEANCQNCGFTQVRLNGLDGAYSQILINSRPIYSPLNSVYGLEQIPTSMIERVEVVRSGGSALYGSNAIAGTVNIITREPVADQWEIGTNLALIDGEVFDKTINYNASLVSDGLRSGVTLFGMFRDRGAYDANGDDFTELTSLNNNTIGAKAFFKPSDFSKITIDLSNIREYRRGGDRLDLAPHFTDITEELDHNIFIGGINFEQESRDRRNRWQGYFSAQTTQRDSYYGGLGGGRTAQDSLTALNAYGKTDDLALVGGVQFSREFSTQDVLTVGLENQYNTVADIIPGYGRRIDQTVNSLGLYGQYEWKPNPQFTALFGLRFDQSTVDGQFDIGQIQRTLDLTARVLSPRITLLYKLDENWQLRGGYARGFRAPQAFNEDLHISSVGGEPQFVILSQSLDKETSDAFTASLNYSATQGFAQLSALIEGFYTQVNDPFTIVSTGSVLDNGSILEEVRNGTGAQVYGTNLEFNIAPSGAWLFAVGGTIQRAEFGDDQVLFEPEPDNDQDPVVKTRDFVRQPNVYGYFSSTWTPGKTFSLDLTGTYTGPMIVPRVVSESGFIDLVDTQSFLDLNAKVSYHLDVDDQFRLEFSGGVQNLLDSFQDDFDRGPQRDSDYVYGPLRPRTLFLGIKIGHLH